MAFDLGVLMDGLATATGVTNAFPYPPEQVTPPCVVVGYPSTFDYDLTFHALGTDGKIECVVPVYYVVGRVIEKAARDQLALLVTGAASIKRLLDGAVAGYDVVNTENMTITTVTFGDPALQYEAARFDVRVIG